MKKTAYILILLALALTALPATAFAHGRHGRSQPSRQTGYALCTLKGCEIIHSHKHNGSWYCGRAGLNGNYEVCGADGCSAIGLHEHDGEYYHCRSYTARAIRARGCCR